jgi:hypothetical protein
MSQLTQLGVKLGAWGGMRSQRVIVEESLANARFVGQQILTTVQQLAPEVFAAANQRHASRHAQILWPSGLNEDLRDVPAGAIYTVVEGRRFEGLTKFYPPAK